MFQVRLPASLGARARALWASLRRHPVIVSITPIGWSLLLGGILVGVVARWRGWLEFQALAVMALVVLLVAGLSVLRRREHVVGLELHRPRVQVGQRAMGRVLVEPAEGKSSGGAMMELPVGKAAALFRVGSLSPGDEHEELFEIPTRRRGVVRIGPVGSIQADPIGAVSRKKEVTDQLELYIHPRITSVSSGAIGFIKDIEGVTTSNLSSSDVSFHALREYQPGDDRRSIHWRTTARLGKLMVRQFEEIMRAHLVLMLSTIEDDYESPDDFELAVSTIGSLAASALREERQVSVLTSNGMLRFPNALGLLDRLAGIELASRGEDLRSLAIKANDVSGISVAGFVTGATDIVTLRGAQLALSAGVFPFAVRCNESLPVARRRAGDLTVLEVSQLADLPAAVRSLE